MTYIPGQQLSQSTFGDTLVTDLRPIVTLKATYGILDECETFSATGGSVTASNSEFVLTTGTSVGGYGVLWSHKPVVYLPGVGCESRATARFTAGVANSLQAVGFFTSTDGMFFGYNGASFGVMHRHGGQLEVRTLTVTAASTANTTATITLNGVAYTAAVTNSGVISTTAHEIEQGLNAGAAASLWHIQHIKDTVVCVYRGVGSKSGTYSATAAAGAFAGTIAQQKAGADPTETWTAKASWNVDTASWLDATKGNLYKFEFAYLGYGPLKFSVFHPTKRTWQLVHVVDWTNVNTSVNLNNPTLRVGWVSASLGSTTNLTVYGASAMGGLQGRADKAHVFGQAGVAPGVTTATQVLSIQVRREFGSRQNNAIAVPKLLSIGTDSTKGAIFRVYLSPTVSGTTVHQYVDQTQSICTYDTAGTTVSGGRNLGVYSVGPSGRASISLDDLNLVLIAGDELVITAEVTSGAASEMTASLTWNEIH